jgi:hypothetical protein
MEYLLLIHSDPQGLKALPKDTQEAALAAYRAYTNAVKEAGVLLSSNRLRPGSATTVVRVRDGKTAVQNGPFIETREELGGYYLIDVPDLDQALSWAARCPGSTHGTVEVRPIWPMNEY